MVDPVTPTLAAKAAVALVTHGYSLSKGVHKAPKECEAFEAEIKEKESLLKYANSLVPMQSGLQPYIDPFRTALVEGQSKLEYEFKTAKDNSVKRIAFATHKAAREDVSNNLNRARDDMIAAATLHTV